MAGHRKVRIGGRDFSLPDGREASRIVKELSQKKDAVEMLPTSASAMDRAKWDLCAEFIKYIEEEGITQRELAKRLEVSEARVSEIVRYRIKKLTAEQLLRYLERIRPDFRLLVA